MHHHLQDNQLNFDFFTITFYLSLLDSLSIDFLMNIYFSWTEKQMFGKESFDLALFVKTL